MCFEKFNYFLKYYCATAGQEDPFELDSNLLLSSGRLGEDGKRQYICTTMKHRYLTIWLTYCTMALLLLFVLFCSYFNILYLLFVFYVLT